MNLMCFVVICYFECYQNNILLYACLSVLIHFHWFHFLLHNEWKLVFGFSIVFYFCICVFTSRISYLSLGVKKGVKKANLWSRCIHKNVSWGTLLFFAHFFSKTTTVFYFLLVWNDEFMNIMKQWTIVADVKNDLYEHWCSEMWMDNLRIKLWLVNLCCCSM